MNRGGELYSSDLDNEQTDDVVFAGNVDMGNNTILNVGTAVNDTDAVNKIYVDTADNLKLNLTGGTLTGNLNMSANKITNLANPTDNFDAVNKITLDTSTAQYLPLDGGTMNGAININGYRLQNVLAPLNNTDASNKEYTDTKLNLSGGTLTGSINMGGNNITNLAIPNSNSDASNKFYADQKVAKTGDIITGNLNMNNNYITNLSDPVNPKDASNRSYTDTKLNLTGGTLTGNLSMNSNRITSLSNPIDNFDAVNKITLDTSTAQYLPLDGGTMNGAININGYRLQNVLAPLNNTDASNKQYTDTADNLKLNLTGGTVTGDLLVNLGADALRTLGCNDISGTKGFIILLGNILNEIQFTLNSPITIQSTNGLLCRIQGNDVIRFGTNVGDFRVMAYQDLIMNNNFIANVHDPNSAQDAATKNYVDTRYIKNYAGYVPVLTSNLNSRCGFTTSATSEFSTNFQSYMPFATFNDQNINNSEWAISGAAVYPVILRLTCPESIAIWRVCLRGRFNAGSSRFTAWQFRASTDNITYVTLVNSTTTLDGTLRYFDITPTNKNTYKYFEFYATAANGTQQPGLAYIQLYNYNVIETN